MAAALANAGLVLVAGTMLVLAILLLHGAATQRVSATIRAFGVVFACAQVVGAFACWGALR